MCDVLSLAGSIETPAYCLDIDPGGDGTLYALLHTSPWLVRYDLGNWGAILDFGPELVLETARRVEATPLGPTVVGVVGSSLVAMRYSPAGDLLPTGTLSWDLGVDEAYVMDTDTAADATVAVMVARDGTPRFHLVTLSPANEWSLVATGDWDDSGLATAFRSDGRLVAMGHGERDMWVRVSSPAAEDMALWEQRFPPLGRWTATSADVADIVVAADQTVFAAWSTEHSFNPRSGGIVAIQDAVGVTWTADLSTESDGTWAGGIAAIESGVIGGFHGNDLVVRLSGDGVEVGRLELGAEQLEGVPGVSAVVANDGEQLHLVGFPEAI